MDEEIFRTYFIRLFKGIRQMEKKFKDLMDPDEKDTFTHFSRSLNDLASVFKLTKKEESLDDKSKIELIKKKNFKKNQMELSKCMFGVGMVPPDMRNKSITFRIMPSKILGFSKV